jgi:hypothetical protein
MEALWINPSDALRMEISERPGRTKRATACDPSRKKMPPAEMPRDRFRHDGKAASEKE